MSTTKTATHSIHDAATLGRLIRQVRKQQSLTLPRRTMQAEHSLSQ